VRSSKQSVSRLRVVPWALLARAALAMVTRWTSLSDKERARLASLVRKSRGRAGNLNARERTELRSLVRKLDLMGAGRELLPLARGSKRAHRRR
jgi:hypothetical protein